MTQLQQEINRARTLQDSFSALSDSIGNPVKATEEEYASFRAHLQDEIDELLTPIEEEESNE